MKNRAKQGSTLSLVVACTIVIALMGIGFIFLTYIFGGHREAQHAADSGSLNVSKRAILSPALASTALATDVGLAMAANLQAPPSGGGANYPGNMGTGVNLLNFNRMVAQAMLVGLNSDAEGSGQSNAQAAFSFIEGSAQSIGAQLQSALTDSSWAATDYNEIDGNVLKMLGAQGAPQFQTADFQAGYMNQLANDNKATNVDMSAFDPKNASYNKQMSPITDYSSGAVASLNSAAFTSGPNAKISYLAGFTPVSAGGSNFYGVPTNPGMQPHLESTSQFGQQTSQPGAGSVYLPPNAFRIGAAANLQAALTQSNVDGSAQAHVVSVSMIGTPSSPFPVSIPGGYIVVDNSSTQAFVGTAPNTDNVAADELGTGILVDKATGDFAYGPGPADSKGNPTPNLIDQWQAYNHDPTAFTPDASKDPPSKGIYNSSGTQVTATEAGKIPYIPNPSQSSPASILCTDNNSSSPNGDPTCIQEATSPPGGLDPFDQAFHPGSKSGGSLSSSSSTASELAQCEMINLYGPTPHGGGPAMNYNYSFGPTGVRIYPNGIPTASNQYAWKGPGGAGGGGFGMAPDAEAATVTTSAGGTACQVTQNGDLVQLFQQVQSVPGYKSTLGGSLSSVQQFLAQRMAEIYPQVTQSNITKIIGDTNAETATTQPPVGVPLALGSTYYIYYSASSPYANNGPGLTIDTTGPKYIGGQSAGARQPDGKVHQVQAEYPILEGMANPYYCYGIHDRLFTTWGSNGAGDDMSGSITATDTAYFQPASGAYGLLGVVKFTETSQVGASLSFGGGGGGGGGLVVNNRN